MAYRILVADDEADIVRLLQDLFTRQLPDAGCLRRQGGPGALLPKARPHPLGREHARYGRLYPVPADSGFRQLPHPLPHRPH